MRQQQCSSTQYLFVELVATGELLERLAELHKRAIWTIFSMNKRRNWRLVSNRRPLLTLGSKRGDQAPVFLLFILVTPVLSKGHSSSFQPALPAGGRPAPVSAAVERRPTPRPTLALAGALAAVQLLPTLELAGLSSRQGGLALNENATVAASSRICLAYCGDFIGRDSVRNPPADCGRYRGQ